MNEKIEYVEHTPGNWCPKWMTAAPVGSSGLLGGWREVKTDPPELMDYPTAARGKPYVLAVDLKGRMSIGYPYRHSTGEIGWVFAKPIGEPTHWMALPKPPNGEVRRGG